MKKSELRQLIREELGKLNEASIFRNSLKYLHTGKTIKEFEFDNLISARDNKLTLIKKYKLINIGGHLVNYKDDEVELTTNY